MSIFRASADQLLATNAKPLRVDAAFLHSNRKGGRKRGTLSTVKRGKVTHQKDKDKATKRQNNKARRQESDKATKQEGKKARKRLVIIKGIDHPHLVYLLGSTQFEHG
jgi:hypothetical protein